MAHDARWKTNSSFHCTVDFQWMLAGKQDLENWKQNIWPEEPFIVEVETFFILDIFEILEFRRETGSFSKTTNICWSMVNI